MESAYQPAAFSLVHPLFLRLLPNQSLLFPGFCLLSRLVPSHTLSRCSTFLARSRDCLRISSWPLFFPLPDSLTLKVCPPLQPVELNPFPPALQPRSLLPSLSLFSFPFRSLVSSIPTPPLLLFFFFLSPPFKPQLFHGLG